MPLPRGCWWWWVYSDSLRHYDRHAWLSPRRLDYANTPVSSSPPIGSGRGSPSDTALRWHDAATTRLVYAECWSRAVAATPQYQFDVTSMPEMIILVTDACRRRAPFVTLDVLVLLPSLPPRLSPSFIFHARYVTTTGLSILHTVVDNILLHRLRHFNYVTIRLLVSSRHSSLIVIAPLSYHAGDASGSIIAFRQFTLIVADATLTPTAYVTSCRRHRRVFRLLLPPDVAQDTAWLSMALIGYALLALGCSPFAAQSPAQGIIIIIIIINNNINTPHALTLFIYRDFRHAFATTFFHKRLHASLPRHGLASM